MKLEVRGAKLGNKRYKKICRKEDIRFQEEEVGPNEDENNEGKADTIEKGDVVRNIDKEI